MGETNRAKGATSWKMGAMSWTKGERRVEQTETREAVAAGWVVGPDGRLRRATKHHMGRRLPTWDYRRPAYYVITIVLADRREPKLGELVVRKPPAGADGASRTDGGDNGARQTDGEWGSVAEARALGLKPDEIEAKVVFSPLGKAIFDHFRRMGEFTPGLEPVYCAVMPDHLHLLVKVVRELKRPLGNAIGGFKTGCEKIYQRLGGEGRLFAEGFVDEIVLKAGQLSAEFDYLVDNPRRLAVKRLFPELFRVSREVAVRFRLAPKGQVGQEAGNSAGRAAGNLAGRAAGVSPAPAAPAVGFFSAIGNHFLLTRPELLQVQVSRRFFAYRRDEKGRLLKDEPPVVATSEFEAKLDEALSAARRGAVIVSPCVSEGEREIARCVFAAGGRVISMQNKGFSPLYKPGGKLFEACADGRLLMLAPAAWPYQVNERPMTRFDATAMNRLCQWIAGDGAAEINYRGMTPANVDELARAAAKVVDLKVNERK